MTDPTESWGRPAQPPPPSHQPQPGYPAGPHAGGSPQPQYSPQGPPDAADDRPRGRLTRLFRDPISIVLVVVIVLAIGAAALVGGEIYARQRADSVVAATTKCEIQDDVKVSFAKFPPFLWQYATSSYGDISVTTAGNQIRNIKGMKAQISIADVRLAKTSTSSGTIGALDATLTWSSEGIQQTIQNSIPLIGSFVSSVKTNAGDGTVELQGMLGSIIVKPEVVDNGISLQVQQLTGLGFTLPREAVQPALDAFSGQLTQNYPLGVHADSVQVTDAGVVSKFSTRNATIPASNGSQDPCFAGL